MSSKFRFAILIFLVFLLIAAAGCSPIKKKSKDEKGEVKVKIPEKKPEEKKQEPVPEKPTTPEKNATTEQPKPKLPPITIDPAETCIGKGSDLNVDNCIKTVAVKEKKADLCDRVKVMTKDVCYYAVAITNKDPLPCFKIQEDALRNKCLSLTAVKAKSLEGCLAIKPIDVNSQFLRDQCLIDLAGALKDISICNRVSGSVRDDKIMIDNCYLKLFDANKHASFCRNLLGLDAKAGCIASAKKGKIQDDCLQLKDQNATDVCLRQTSYELKDYKVCLPIVDTNNHQECLWSLVDTNATKPLCDGLSEYRKKNSCFHKAGKREKATANCTSIVGDRLLQAQCYYDVAVITKNAIPCDSISPQERDLADVCYSGTAFLKLEPALCEKVVNVSTYYNCFLDIAIKLNDNNVCTMMVKKFFPSYSNYQFDSLCLKDFAVETKQDFLCNKITQTDVKEACKDGNAIFH